MQVVEWCSNLLSNYPSKHIMCRKSSVAIHCCKGFNYFISIWEKKKKKDFKEEELSLDTMYLMTNTDLSF